MWTSELSRKEAPTAYLDRTARDGRQALQDLKLPDADVAHSRVLADLRSDRSLASPSLSNRLIIPVSIIVTQPYAPVKLDAHTQKPPAKAGGDIRLGDSKQLVWLAPLILLLGMRWDQAKEVHQCSCFCIAASI